jgi:hypothetical protein
MARGCGIGVTAEERRQASLASLGTLSRRQVSVKVRNGQYTGQNRPNLLTRIGRYSIVDTVPKARPPLKQRR